ncbi:MAG: EamA family transporter, partial [Propionibacteriaceae bacterium]|nr:EamA family transporter [Propionibacteriaceae bacterium]
MWLGFAFAAALFAGLTAVLAKIGVRHTDSTLATAVRTIVVLGAAWLMVFLVGSQDQLATLTTTTLVFLVLSGLATGGSWLCYFRALQLGEVNRVAPVDRSSLVLTVLFAMLFLSETDYLTTRLPGLALIGLGT